MGDSTALRILVVAGWIYPDAEGGSFRVAFEVARGLSERGHQVIVLTSHCNGSDPPEQTFGSLRVVRYPTWRPSGMGLYASTFTHVAQSLRSLLRGFRPDIVHLHHLISAFAACLTREKFGCPIVLTMYMPYFLEHRDRRIHERSTEGAGRSRRTEVPALLGLSSGVLRAMDDVVLRASDRIVILSRFVRELIGKYYPRVEGKLFQIPGGVDPAFFRPRADRAALRQQLELPDGPVFLSVRRLEARMGLDVMLESFSKVVADVPNASLVVAGRGSWETRLRKQVSRLGISGRVLFAGFVPEQRLPDTYAAADFSVMPTRALEGFGLSAIESLACGTPVLATREGGMGEFLLEIQPDWTISEASADALSRTMLRALREPLQSDFAQRARERIIERFSWDRVVEQYERLFVSTVHREGEARP